MGAIQNSQRNEKSEGGWILLQKRYNKVVWLAFLMAFFNQVSGINFILYYAPEILERAGLVSKDLLGSSIALGGTNLLFTFVGLYQIDLADRRVLLLIGALGYIVTLGVVAWCFATGASSEVLLAFLLLFIAAHAVGQGAVIWVFISEIFPNNTRAISQSFGVSLHWIFAALITLLSPVFLVGKNGVFRDNFWPIFAFFALMLLGQIVWVLTSMPETKGVSLEDLEDRLIRK